MLVSESSLARFRVFTCSFPSFHWLISEHSRIRFRAFYRRVSESFPPPPHRQRRALSPSPPPLSLPLPSSLSPCLSPSLIALCLGERRLRSRSGPQPAPQPQRLPGRGTEKTGPREALQGRLCRPSFRPLSAPFPPMPVRAGRRPAFVCVIGAAQPPIIAMIKCNDNLLL